MLKITEKSEDIKSFYLIVGLILLFERIFFQIKKPINAPTDMRTKKKLTLYNYCSSLPTNKSVLLIIRILCVIKVILNNDTQRSSDNRPQSR